MSSTAYPLPSAARLRRLDRILGRDWQVALPFIAPIAILMVAFIAWPLIEAVVISFTARSIRGEQYWVWFDNYIRLWQDPFYWQAVRITIIYTASCIILKFIFGLIAALVINAQTRGRNILTGLVLLPWIIPSVVQALTWKSIFDPLFGALNYILLQLGVISEGISWLGNPRLALPAVILANVWAGIPFFTVNILAGLQSIPQELYEAAEVDGASEWQRFRHITLPGIRFVVLVAVRLSTIWTFNSFEVIFLLTGGGPAGLTRVYSVLTYQYGMIRLRFGLNQELKSIEEDLGKHEFVPPYNRDSLFTRLRRVAAESYISTVKKLRLHDKKGALALARVAVRELTPDDNYCAQLREPLNPLSKARCYDQAVATPLSAAVGQTSQIILEDICRKYWNNSDLTRMLLVGLTKPSDDAFALFAKAGNDKDLRSDSHIAYAELLIWKKAKKLKKFKTQYPERYRLAIKPSK
jgi:ABC-type sugar transport system permease subunit